MSQTGYEFWFEPQITVEQRPDGWWATETSLGLSALAADEGLARRHLGADIDQLLAQLLERGTEAVELHFRVRGIPYRLVPSTIAMHPELDDDTDGNALEDFIAEHRRAYGR